MKLCSSYLREPNVRKTLTTTLSMFLDYCKKDYLQAYKKQNGHELTNDEMQRKFESQRKED